MEAIVPLFDDDEFRYIKSPYVAEGNGGVFDVYVLKITQTEGKAICIRALGPHLSEQKKCFIEFPNDPDRLRKFAALLNEMADEAESAAVVERKGDGKNDGKGDGDSVGSA